jgi:hypothetical protein
VRLTFFRPVTTGLQRVPWSWIFLTQLTWTMHEFNERLSGTALPFPIGPRWWREAPQFQGWEVKTKSGEVLTGLQGHWRSGGAASLLLLDGRERTIAAAQVESFRALESSLMPEGLAALFSVEELRDLVAFLEQLR